MNEQIQPANQAYNNTCNDMKVKEKQLLTHTQIYST